MSDPEWTLLRQAQQSDHPAWEQLVATHYPRLVNLAFLLTGARASAQDVAQETLLRAVTRSVRHEDGTVAGYLATIAYRLALSEQTRIRRAIAMDPESIDDRSDPPDRQVMASEQAAAVAQALAALAADERAVLVLRFYGDLSYEEIARVTGAPLGTVKSRMFRAVKNCRECLSAKGELL